MKKALIVVLSIILALAVIFTGISAYLGYSMTRTERIPVMGSPSDLNLTYENVTFPSLDEKLTLHGWLLPGTKDGTIIIMVHGNGYNRNDPSIGMLDIAGQLVNRGYSVLMFDLRGYGESDGSTVSGGYFEKRDVQGAVNYAKKLGYERIGVLGFSLGAVSSLLAAAEDEDIDVVIADSSFADLNDIMGPEFKKRTKAPEIFLRPILFMIKVMFGVDFAAIRPVEAIPEIAPRPVLIIHGENDAMITVTHAYRLYAAVDNPRDELWVVPGAEHTRSFKVQPQEYIERVAAFFDENLK